MSAKQERLMDEVYNYRYWLWKQGLYGDKEPTMAEIRSTHFSMKIELLEYGVALWKQRATVAGYFDAKHGEDTDEI